MPLRNQNQLLADKFRDWFDDLLVLANAREVFHQGAQLRADHKSLETPDAIHLAPALHDGCDEFWTNDERLSKVAPAFACRGINCITDGGHHWREFFSSRQG